VFFKGDKVQVNTAAVELPPWVTDTGVVYAFITQYDGQSLVFLKFKGTPSSLGHDWGFYPKWIPNPYLTKV
jgi:hypothetical protein